VLTEVLSSEATHAAKCTVPKWRHESTPTLHERPRQDACRDGDSGCCHVPEGSDLRDDLCSEERQDYPQQCSSVAPPDSGCGRRDVSASHGKGGDRLFASETQSRHERRENGCDQADDRTNDESTDGDSRGRRGDREAKSQCSRISHERQPVAADENAKRYPDRRPERSEDEALFQKFDKDDRSAETDGTQPDGCGFVETRT